MDVHSAAHLPGGRGPSPDWLPRLQESWTSSGSGPEIKACFRLRLTNQHVELGVHTAANSSREANDATDANGARSTQNSDQSRRDEAEDRAEVRRDGPER